LNWWESKIIFVDDDDQNSVLEIADVSENNRAIYKLWEMIDTQEGGELGFQNFFRFKGFLANKTVYLFRVFER